MDLDATLAEWGDDGLNCDVMQIGRPIPAMVERVKRWRAAGREVRIVTARVGACDAVNDEGVADNVDFAAGQRALIERWCLEHLGEVLPVTASKDFQMAVLYDDRCVQVMPNTGQLAHP